MNKTLKMALLIGVIGFFLVSILSCGGSRYSYYVPEIESNAASPPPFLTMAENLNAEGLEAMSKNSLGEAESKFRSAKFSLAQSS